MNMLHLHILQKAWPKDLPMFPVKIRSANRRSEPRCDFDQGFNYIYFLPRLILVYKHSFLKDIPMLDVYEYYVEPGQPMDCLIQEIINGYKSRLNESPSVQKLSMRMFNPMHLRGEYSHIQSIIDSLLRVSFTKNICREMELDAGMPVLLRISDEIKFTKLNEIFCDPSYPNSRIANKDDDLGNYIKEGITQENRERGINGQALEYGGRDYLDDLIDNSHDLGQSNQNDEPHRLHPLSKALDGRHLRPRDGYLQVEGVLGSYCFSKKIITLYPSMWRILAPSIAEQLNIPVETALLEIGRVVLIHELCHSCSHVFRDRHSGEDWPLDIAMLTPAAVHELIAGYFTDRLLRSKVFSRTRDVHNQICNTSTTPYRLWRLIKWTKISHLRFKAQLHEWRRLGTLDIIIDSYFADREVLDFLDDLL